MNTGPKRIAFRYLPEELETRDYEADESFADGYIDRNREAIDRDLKAARAAIRRGEGKIYPSAEDLAAEPLRQARS